MEYLNMLQTTQVILKIDNPAGKLKKKRAICIEGKSTRPSIQACP